jgi:cytochrome c oxidase subunit 2
LISLKLKKKTVVVKNDLPEEWQMTFQDPAGSVMQGIIDLHHDIMFFVVLISVFVS